MDLKSKSKPSFIATEERYKKVRITIITQLLKIEVHLNFSTSADEEMFIPSEKNSDIA